MSVFYFSDGESIDPREVTEIAAMRSIPSLGIGPYVHFRFWLHGELHVRTVKHETYESALDEVNTFNAFRMAIAMSDAALMRRQRDELLAAARRHIDATRAMEALSNLVTRIEGGAK